VKIWKGTNTLDGYLPELEYAEDPAAAEVMLVGGKKFDLQTFPQLKGIFKTGVGTDNLPFSEAEKRGISIGLPSETTCEIIYEETAAFTCHLLLSGWYAGVGNWAAWQKADRPCLRPRRLLVVGTGRIGQRVFDKMAGFLNVSAFDAARNDPAQLEPFVRAADIVSLHIPLTPATKGFFGVEKLGWMKDGALLVNTSRGPVVEEDALFDELSADRLRAAFDVFWEEPYAGKLAALPPERFFRTPHIASTCREFLQGTAQDFLQFLNGIEAEA
jgi:phosphoglycerate dehydrogenase-like enzyme